MRLVVGGRNRRVAEAYVHAYQSGSPKSFDILEVSGVRPLHGEVCTTCAEYQQARTAEVLKWVSLVFAGRAAGRPEAARGAHFRRGPIHSAGQGMGRRLPPFHRSEWCGLAILFEIMLHVLRITIEDSNYNPRRASEMCVSRYCKWPSAADSHHGVQICCYNEPVAITTAAGPVKTG